MDKDVPVFVTEAPKPEKKPTWWSKTPFWARLVALLGTAFIFMFSIRFKEAGGWPLLLVMLFLVEVVWLIIAAFKKVAPGANGRKGSRRVTRILVLLLVVPIVLITVMGFGTVTATAIAPYSAEEIAAQQARKAEEERRTQARKAAEEAKKASEAATEAQAKATADANAISAQQAAAEKAAAEQDAAEQKRLADLKSSKPILYAAEYCQLMASRIGMSSSPYLTVDKTGSTLFLTTKSSSDNRGAFMFACVSKALSLSAPLLSSISSTNALAGTKSWTENNMDFEWSFHPNSGLNMSVIRKPSCFLFVCN